jgi:hypothetical protein
MSGNRKEGSAAASGSCRTEPEFQALAVGDMYLRQVSPDRESTFPTFAGYHHHQFLHIQGIVMAEIEQIDCHG